MKRIGLLPAAGMARRLGITTPKELLERRGRPVIDHSVRHLLDAGVERIVVVIRPDKVAIRAHLERAWPGREFSFPEQHGEIGNLIDGLRAATAEIAGHEVHLLFPDTVITPNPFTAQRERELLLLCHDAGERWPHFGVVDAARRRVEEKPAAFPGTTWCWGAAVWGPTFTERLAGVASLTDAINAAEWDWAPTIEHYEDIGLHRVGAAR